MKQLTQTKPVDCIERASMAQPTRLLGFPLNTSSRGGLSLLTIAAAVFALSLTGCSSQQRNYDGTRLVVDWEQVQRIEQSARGNASVIWLNYPRKRLDAQGRVVERINQHGEVVARYEYDDEDNPVQIR